MNPCYLIYMFYLSNIFFFAPDLQWVNPVDKPWFGGCSGGLLGKLISKSTPCLKLQQTSSLNGGRGQNSLFLGEG